MDNGFFIPNIYFVHNFKLAFEVTSSASNLGDIWIDRIVFKEQETITAGGSGNWNSATNNAPWPAGKIPLLLDNVIIPATRTVTHNLSIGGSCYDMNVSGTLTFDNTAGRALTLFGELIVNNGGVFNNGTGAKTLTVWRHITANGNVNLGASNLVLFSTNSCNISGSATTVAFNTLTVNKGSNQAPIVNLDRAITLTVPTGAASTLILTNGTFKINAAVTLTPWSGSQTIVPSTARLWLNHASAIIQSNGAGTASNAGSPTINGWLSLDAGTFRYGSGNNTMTFSSGGVLDMRGGTVEMHGAIAFADASATWFQMYDGLITVNPQSANALAVGTTIFSLGANTAINWRGGKVQIVNPHNTAGGISVNIPATGGASGSKTFTNGAILELGNGVSTLSGGVSGSTAGFGVSILNTSAYQGVNLKVNNLASTTPSRMARTLSSNWLRHITIDNGGYLFLGQTTTGYTTFILESITNNGTLAGTEPSGSQHLGALYFPSDIANTISGSGLFTNIPTLSVDKTASSTLTCTNSSLLRVNRVNMFQGFLNQGSNFTIGKTGVTSPIIQIGANAAVTSGKFSTTAPTLDEGAGGLVLIYSLTNTQHIMGSYNEMATNKTSIRQLQINNTLGLLMDRNFTITTDMVFTLGKVTANAFNLTMGSSATVPGNLTYVATGGFEFTSGSLTRWFPTSSLPTTFSATPTYPAYGFFPIITNNNLRTAALSFTDATSITTGGRITVKYNDSKGLMPISPAFVDNSVPVNTRSRASYQITVNSELILGGGKNVDLRVEGNSIFSTISDITKIKPVLANSAVGTSLVGTGTTTAPQANRRFTTISDLSNTFYLASDGNVIRYNAGTAQSGPWGTASTWTDNQVPSLAENAIINTTHNVDISVNTEYTCDSLLINGSLTANTGVLTIGNSEIGRNRVVDVNGSLTVTGTSTVNINGGLKVNNNSTFNQSNGIINVNGNNGDPITSFPSTCDLVSFGTPSTPLSSGTTISVTNGKINIVNPHATVTTPTSSQTGHSIGYWANAGKHVNISDNHLTTIGDSISTVSGGNASGFTLRTGAEANHLHFGKLKICSGNASNREVNVAGSLLTVNSDLTISNSSIARFTINNLYNGGNLLINEGSKIYIPTTFNFSKLVSGVATPSTVNQTIEIKGEAINIISTSSNFNNVVLNNQSTGSSLIVKKLNGGQPFAANNFNSLLGNVRIDSSVIWVQSIGNFTFTNNTNSLNINGTFDAYNGVTLTGGIFNINDTFITRAINGLSSNIPASCNIGNASTVYYNGNDNQNVSSAVYNNLILLNNRRVNSTLSLPSYIGIRGEFITSVDPDNVNAQTNSNSVEFLKNGAQNVTSLNYYDLIISGGGGKKTLLSDINVENSLDVNNGGFNFETDGGIITLSPNSTLTEKASSYVLGNIQTTRLVTPSTSQDFGNIGFTVNLNQGGMGQTLVKRVTGEQLEGALGFSIPRYFEITPNSPNNINCNVIIDFFNGEIGSSSYADLRMYKKPITGTKNDWTEVNKLSLDSINNTFVGTNITGFSTFTLGDFNSPLMIPIPLPVSWLDFKAKAVEKDVQLNWSVASELNNDYYVIERSNDGKNWEGIGSIKGAGNSNSKLFYAFKDSPKNATVLYYRIKQVDFDGKSTNSVIRQVSFKSELNVNVYPVPAINEVTISVSQNFTGRIIDVTGRILKSFSSNDGLYTVNIESLNAGIYSLELYTNGEFITKKIIKQ